MPGPRSRSAFGFGDFENDLTVFAVVEMSVAIGNALPQVKEHSLYVTGSADEDGTVGALEHFGLMLLMK